MFFTTLYLVIYNSQMETGTLSLIFFPTPISHCDYLPQIGFNAGNGTQAYEYKPYSQASVLRDLTGRGWANGFPGRHIFRIDERIMLGTCNKDIGKVLFSFFSL